MKGIQFEEPIKFIPICRCICTCMWYSDEFSKHETGTYFNKEKNIYIYITTRMIEKAFIIIKYRNKSKWSYIKL